jgi:hypothetical protein
MLSAARSGLLADTGAVVAGGYHSRAALTSRALATSDTGMRTPRVTIKPRLKSFMTGCCGKPISRGNGILMRQFEKLVLDTDAHEIFLLWRVSHE